MPRLSITRGGRRSYRWLRGGRAGNVETLREMAAMVRRSVERDAALRDFANEILVRAGARGTVRQRSLAEVEAIFRFVQFDAEQQHGVIFRRDPVGGEAIQDARETLRRGFGDCDDFAVLLSTLLGCVGWPTRFVVLRVNPGTGDGFDHVYCEVLDPDGLRWVALDPTNEQAPVGWEEPGALERRTFGIFAEGDDLEGFFDVFKKIGLAVAPVGAALIPGAGAFLAPAVAAAAGAVGERQAKKEQERGLNVQFDQLARQTTQLFDAVQAKGAAITAADAQQVTEAYQRLAQVAAQSPTPGIAAQWASPAYDAAYRTRLKQIEEQFLASPAGRRAQADAATGQGVGASGGSQQPGAAAGIDATTLLAAGGLGLGLLWILRR